MYIDAGTSAANAHFYGAIVAKKIILSGSPAGSPHVHYDTALRNVPYRGVAPFRSLLLWREVANPSEPEYYSFVYP